MVLTLKRVTAALATAAILVVAVARLSGCGQSASGDSPLGSEPSEAGSVTPLRHDFKLFRREARPRDEIPASVISAQIVRRLGLDLSEAKLARATRFSSLYAIPGRRAVCLLDTSGVSSPCWPPGTVEEGKAVSTSFCAEHLPAGELQMVGLVPDGVSKVWIARSDGSRLPVPVEQNVFVAQLTSGGALPSRIAWRRAGRAHSQIAGISPRVARMPCAFDR